MTQPSSVRAKIFDTLQEHQSTGFIANLDDLLITVASGGIIAITSLRTFPFYENISGPMSILIGLFALLIVGEFCLGFWAAGAVSEYQGLFGRIRFLATWSSLFEILAVVHVILLATGQLNDVYNPWNLLFVAHFIQISRYISTLRLGLTAIVNAVKVMTPLLVILLPLMMFSAYLLYMAESPVQPEKFKDLWSALWFAIVTSTTVGYGDMSPITTSGQVFAAIHMLLTIGLVGAIGAQVALQIDNLRKLGLDEQEGGMTDDQLERLAVRVVELFEQRNS